ncbi:MAG: FkbM family methyltransferase [Candidatus Colwellbacteria bacterium]|nr:FkbM family methyltransferase [Candidatus Colwellbacteria bacterium]
MKQYDLRKIWRKLWSIGERISATRKRQRSKSFLQKIFGRDPAIPPLTLVDVGASGDLQKSWRGLGEYLRVIGFEPDKKAYEELVKRSSKKKDGEMVTYLNLALHNKAAEADFFITRKQMVSSMLLPNEDLIREFPVPERFDIVASRKIKTETLDAALQQAGVQDIDFIKLDTQGSELFILQGAAETLRKKALGVEVELEFAEVYKNQPLFGDVDQFLRNSGFALFDFVDVARWERENIGASIHGCKSQVIFVNALYMKEKDSFFATMRPDKSKLFKAVSICVLYECFDYAVALLQEGLKKNIVDAVEYRHAIHAITRS